jgi:uncharacterized protein YdhG (YjbR/CyaY superfamily)
VTANPIASVADYIAAQPALVQPILRRLRAIVRRAAPAADEQIRYGIAGFKLHGAPLIYFAGWKKHFSIYPATREVLAALGDQLAGYVVEKGTIRFSLNEPFPVALIERIARLRVKAVAAAAKAKPAARKPAARKTAPKKAAPKKAASKKAAPKKAAPKKAAPKKAAPKKAAPKKAAPRKAAPRKGVPKRR